jgi:tetratricopeptide (TPR) repeat protein
LATSPGELPITPLSVSVNYGMGKIYFYKDEPEDAIFWFDKTINLDPVFADAYSSLGEAYMTNEYERGIAILRKAVELSNNKPIVLAHLAYVYSKFEEKEKAIRILEEFNERLKKEEMNLFSFVPIYIV